MKTVIVLFIALMAGLVSGETGLLTAQKIDYINRCQADIFYGEPGRYYVTANEWVEYDSTDPGGYLFKIAAMQAEMTAEEENIYEDSFISLCDSLNKRLDNYLISCSSTDSAICYLYLGHLYSYRSLYEARFGSKWSAARNGYRANGAYKKGVEIDTAFYDLYFGLGSFHYWKSAKSGFLGSIKLISNEKEKGIKELKLAVDSSLFSKDVAKLALAHIYINEEKYDSALLYCDDLSIKYNSSLTFWWPMAECCYQKQDYEMASHIYQSIFYKKENSPGNYYNLIEAAYWSKKSAVPPGYQHRINEVVDFLSSKIDSIPEHTRKRQKDKLKFLLKD